jgi:hypothetical protein
VPGKSRIVDSTGAADLENVGVRILENCGP